MFKSRPINIPGAYKAVHCIWRNHYQSETKSEKVQYSDQFDIRFVFEKIEEIIHVFFQNFRWYAIVLEKLLLFGPQIDNEDETFHLPEWTEPHYRTLIELCRSTNYPSFERIVCLIECLRYELGFNIEHLGEDHIRAAKILETLQNRDLSNKWLASVSRLGTLFLLDERLAPQFLEIVQNLDQINIKTILLDSMAHHWSTYTPFVDWLLKSSFLIFSQDEGEKILGKHALKLLSSSNIQYSQLHDLIDQSLSSLNLANSIKLTLFEVLESRFDVFPDFSETWCNLILSLAKSNNFNLSSKAVLLFGKISNLPSSILDKLLDFISIGDKPIRVYAIVTLRKLKFQAPIFSYKLQELLKTKLSPEEESEVILTLFGVFQIETEKTITVIQNNLVKGKNYWTLTELVELAKRTSKSDSLIKEILILFSKEKKYRKVFLELVQILSDSPLLQVVSSTLLPTILQGLQNPLERLLAQRTIIALHSANPQLLFTLSSSKELMFFKSSKEGRNVCLLKELKIPLNELFDLILNHVEDEFLSISIPSEMAEKEKNYVSSQPNFLEALQSKDFPKRLSVIEAFLKEELFSSSPNILSQVEQSLIELIEEPYLDWHFRRKVIHQSSYFQPSMKLYQVLFNLVTSPEQRNEDLKIEALKVLTKLFCNSISVDLLASSNFSLSEFHVLVLDSFLTLLRERSLSFETEKQLIQSIGFLFYPNNPSVCLFFSIFLHKLTIQYQNKVDYSSKFLTLLTNLFENKLDAQNAQFDFKVQVSISLLKLGERDPKKKHIQFLFHAVLQNNKLAFHLEILQLIEECIIMEYSTSPTLTTFLSKFLQTSKKEEVQSRVGKLLNKLAK